MPVEYEYLINRPVPLDRCPRCGDRPFDPFLRGMVQNWWRRLRGKPYCALVCSKCKERVGYEEP